MNRRSCRVPAALLLLPFAAGTALAGIDRWTTNFPALGAAVGVGANALDPSRLYAWSGDGARFFRSLDGGQTWTSDPTLSGVSGIVFEPGSLDTVYAIGASVRKSVDAGGHWQNLGFDAIVGAGPSQLVIGESMPRTLYLGYGGGPGGLSGARAVVHRSADSGQTWTTIFDSGFWGSVLSLVVAPSAPTVYAFLGGFAFRDRIVSLDGGETWASRQPTCLGDPFFWADFFTLDEAVDPRDPNLVYYSTAEGRLFRRACEEIDTGLPAAPGLGAPFFSNIVIDPTNPSRLYAATLKGVFRTLDGGLHWTKFSDGLPDDPATSLTIDATGRFLHVAAGGGVYDYTIAEPCVPQPTALCFLGGRFLATVAAVDPRTGRLEHGTAVSRGDRFGYFSLPGFTGDASFPEVVVKMADARAIPGQGFWLFHSGLTDLQYTLSVLDTATGRQKTYRNDRADPSELCGGADTATFGPDNETGSASRPALEARAPTQIANASLTLLDRFQATLTATDPRTGRVAAGVAIPQDARWGYFSLPAFTGDPAFPEVFAKMVDATSLPGGFFWVFHTGLTDLEYTLTVTDPSTGAVKTYHNDRSDPARLCGGADTAAFTN